MEKDISVFDVKALRLSHEFILGGQRKCEYPHGRGCHGIVCALSGAADFRFYGGERLKVAQGDILLLHPSAAYTVSSEGQFRHYAVNFEHHAGKTEISSPYVLIKGGLDDEIRRLAKRTVELAAAKRQSDLVRAVGCIYELAATLYDRIFADSKGTSDRLRAAREYIEQSEKRELSLEHLASLCHMSATNFRRLWKRSYSVTPMGYRDKIMIDRAKEYLSSGYYSVSETAYKLGFDDPSYFVRFFRKNTGITPGEYKKQSV
jgi:AraC-like DNA-binding protein